VRLAAFAGLCGLAAWRYAAVEVPAPAARALLVAAIATAAAGAMIVPVRVSERAGLRTRRQIILLRGGAIVLALVIALLVIGVPAHLLLHPGRWGHLAHELDEGLQAIGTTLWPYAGHDTWTRLAIRVPLVVLPLAAAAIGFWPGRRLEARRVAALALLLTLYVLGVIDSNDRAFTLEGLALVVLVAAWLWLPGMRRRRAGAALAWLGLAGALAAVLATGLGNRPPWLDYRGWNLLGLRTAGTTFAWDETYGPISWPRTNRVMFTVRAARRQFWKVTTLDRFDGLRFVRSGTNAGSDHDLPLPLNDTWYAFATVTIRGLEANPLPSEQGTTLGLNSAAPIVHDADGTARAAGSPLHDGSSYTVLSYDPAPRPAELRAAPRKYPHEYLRYTDFDLPAPGQTGLDVAASDPARAGRFLTSRTIGAPAAGSSPGAVPAVRRRILDSPYGPMYRLARKLAGAARSPYDVAVSIESYLKANLGYNEQPPRRRYPLEAFLFEDSTGYCQQFSGAMALMLRMDGIPARVAVGFLPGSYDAATHSYQVRETDAHAWVEVYFSGTGWVPFNPTPSRVIGRPQRFPLYESSRTVNALQALSATVGSARASSGEQRPKPPAARPRHAGALGAGWIVAAAVLLLALAALVGRWLIGWVRLRRSLAGDCELACAELARALRRFGYATAPTATLAQLERLVWVHAGAQAASYVRLLRERRYGEGAARVARLRDRRRLRRGLSARLGLDHRLRGLWALPPGTLAWRVGGLAGAAGRRAQVGGP